MPDDAYAEWLRSRPAYIQELAKKFALGKALYIAAKKYYVLGFAEGETAADAMLIISHFDPAVEYEKALENRAYICPDHISDYKREE